MPATSTLIRIAIVAVFVFAIYRIIADGGEPDELSPRWIDGSPGAQVELPDPISAATIFQTAGEGYLVVVTKFGSDRVEPAVLRVIRIGPSGALEVVGSQESPIDVEAPPAGVAITNGQAFVPLAGADRSDPGLWIIDLQDPTAPVSSGIVDVDIPLRSVAALEDRYLIASSFDRDFRIYDVRTSGEPAVVSGFEVSISVAPDIVVEGKTLFIDHMAGIVMVDLSNPELPAELSRIDHPDWQIPGVPPTGTALLTPDERFDYQIPAGNYLGISVSGDLLAVAASDLGLLLFDIGEPVDPQQAGAFQPGRRVIDAAFVGGNVALLTATANEQGLFEYRVELVETDPAAEARVVATLEGPHRYQRLLTYDDRLLVLFNDSVLEVHDTH